MAPISAFTLWVPVPESMQGMVDRIILALFTLPLSNFFTTKNYGIT